MTEMPITLVDYRHPEDYKKAKTEFIMFVNGSRDAVTVRNELYQVYKNNPQYRKLSMVSPVTLVGDTKIYGYVHSSLGWEPKHSPSSKEPYAIQAGNITYSIIRRAALDRINYDFYGDNELVDSVGLSTALWASGQRIYINPNTEIQVPTIMTFGLGTILDEELKKLFKREMIG